MSGEKGEGLLGVLEGLGEELVDTVMDAMEQYDGLVGKPYVQPGDVTFDYDLVAPLGVCAGLPKSAHPKLSWMIQVGVVAIEIHKNQKDVLDHLPHELQKHATVQLARKGLSREDARKALTRHLSRKNGHQHRSWFRDLVQTLRVRPAHEVAPPLSRYAELFEDIPVPAIASVFQEDASFVDRRVAGPNPTSLTAVDTLPTALRYTDADLKAVLPGEDLSTVLSSGRAFVVDYGGVQPLINGTYPNRQKYVYEPIALFVQTAEALVPVAIQGGQDADRHPLVLPNQGTAWLLAKSMVDVADANFHELVAHLGRTHLVVEPFCVSTNRKLDPSHPLRRLLDPHIEGTLFINWAAADFLIAPKNVVDELLSGTIDAGRTTSVSVTGSRSFHDSYLPAWLKAQGLDDTTTLPHFPFRDDALQVWAAIQDWVSEYVHLAWPTEGSLVADGDLQAWSQDVGGYEGGRVTGFGDGPDGTIVSRAYLVGALTMVIFTASAMHAAVNFPQKTVMSYAPAMPLAGYRPAPASGEAITEETYLSFLPGVDQALIQLNTLQLLGGVYHTKLGHYEEGTFDDPAIVAASDRFLAALEIIEANIIDANDKGIRKKFPYEHLLPSKIPQSINI